MKRTLHTIAAIGAVLALAGCGGGLDDETQAAPASSGTPVDGHQTAAPASASRGIAAGAPVPSRADPYERALVNPRADPKAAAEYLNGLNLFLDSREEILAAVAAYAAANPRLEVIRGYGWRLEAFDGAMPTALELDGVVRDRPVILLSADLRVAWRNSRGAAEPIEVAKGG